MNPQLRVRIKQLFDAALDLEEPARSTYMEEACAADLDLRQAVEELQQGRGAAKGFLDDEVSSDLTPVFRPQQLIAGRFRIVRFHGRGGMGEVYEAWDERLRLRVGLKTIRREQAPDADALQRFQREIRVAREVAHPNLCRVFDLLEHVEPNQSPESVITCLTMEWLEGETLQQCLGRGRPLSLADALPIVRQVSAALDALHAAHIVHRDLKPGNIMLVPSSEGDRRVVVMDFGLAKPLGSGDEWFESNVDSQAGAPYFMAPEQLRNQKSTAASDIYALGLVIDEMVTASRAFSAGSIGALYYQRLWERPLSPIDRSENLPANWCRTILRCLEIEPAARYASAGEIVRELEGHPVSPPSVPARFKIFSWPALLILLVLVGASPFALRPPKVEAAMVVFQIDDLANDPAYAHLSAGMTAALVSRLTKIEGLAVKRFYSVRSKAPLASVTDRFQLDGDLQKHQNRIRLNMRLVDTSKGDSIVWGEAFDTSLDNPLELQLEIVGRAVNELEKQVFSDSTGLAHVQFAGFRAAQSIRELLAWAQPGNHVLPKPSAYHAYLRGKQLFEDRGPASVEVALQLFQQAIAEAPEYAVAHAALADAYRAQIDGRRGEQEILLEKARQSSLLAVRLDSNSPEAHTALAGVQQAMWEWAASEASYRQAINLDPKSPVAYRRYAGLVIQFGRFAEAFSLIQKGLELDPYDYPSQAAYGLCLGLAQRYEEAEKQLKWTLTQKDFITPHNNLGLLYARMGIRSQGEDRKRYLDLALREADSVLALELRGKTGIAAVTPVSTFMFAIIHSARGDEVAAREALQKLEALEQIGRVAPASLALVYASRNDKAAALAYLRQALNIKDRGLLYLKVLSLWDPIRDTDEFREIVAKMRL